MSHFVQIHLLTPYAPSNLNRDDLGRPKTAVMGGTQRLRVSSQCLKRAWRTSDTFASALNGHIGTRTKEMGTKIEQDLIKAGRSAKDAREIAREIAKQFGALDGDTANTKQLVHFSPEELRALDATVQRFAAGGKPTEAEAKALRSTDPRAADIALFGRMLADSPDCNADAAAQVAHAITVHETAVETDYFTAVDDLNDGSEDVGAGHIGETGFGAGVFYFYLCINRDQLLSNLGGDQALAQRTLRALLEACAKVSPDGKQNSFGARSWASWIRVEHGDQPPRSLAAAFLQPIKAGKDGVLANAIAAAASWSQNLDNTYGPNTARAAELDVHKGTGSFAALLDFVAQPLKEG